MAHAAHINHPETILRALDRHLTRPARLILYGRAAIVLGFSDSPAECATTMDVDAILPRGELSAIEENEDFWDALQKTNSELEPSGLYITHLFVDDQLILTSDWIDRLQPIDLKGLQHLQLLRPDTGDLILTKMMRVDPQDRQDIHFLISQMAVPDLEPYLTRANVPEIAEIQQAFEQNQHWLTSSSRAKHP